MENFIRLYITGVQFSSLNLISNLIRRSRRYSPSTFQHRKLEIICVMLSGILFKTSNLLLPFLQPATVGGWRGATLISIYYRSNRFPYRCGLFAK